ncbi:hypothetical protein [Adonisia turfae]|nr:hypothetical protein [Adonisia turfae]
MQTLTQKPTPTKFQITETSLTQHAVTWNDRTIGLIQCSPELGLNWEYVRYSAYPNTFMGSYDDCVAQAEQDYAEQNTPPQADVCLAEVIDFGPVSKPASRYSNGPIFIGGHSQVQLVSIRGLNDLPVDDRWTDTLWVPLGFAKTLRRGDMVECFQDLGKVGIRLPRFVASAIAA